MSSIDEQIDKLKLIHKNENITDYVYCSNGMVFRMPKVHFVQIKELKEDESCIKNFVSQHSMTGDPSECEYLIKCEDELHIKKCEEVSFDNPFFRKSGLVDQKDQELTYEELYETIKAEREKQIQINIENTNRLKDQSKLFKDIVSKEDPSMNSFEFMPEVFNGIKTSTFGMSSFFDKNPFFELEKIATDSTKSWNDRTQSIQYMQKIPHIQRDNVCIKSTLSIVSDKQYRFENRYHFFANNERIVKLNYEIVNACHKYVYENFDSLSDTKIPLMYKILSAQFILVTFPVGTYDIDGVQEFLKSVATDKDVSINYRAECADILDRTGYNNYKTIGRDIINELGNLYVENQKSTIYTNLQNVHDLTVTKKIIDTLKLLMTTIKTTKNTGEIYERIVEITKNDSRSEAVIRSFQRILIDTSKFENISMSDIMLLVWEKICFSDNKNELEKRLVDELYETDQSCSSGYLTRLMNVLSGFFEDIQPIKISFNEQLRTNVFARYSCALRTLLHHEQEIIIEEMTKENKPCIEEFIFSYSPKEELKEEFKEYLSEEEFDRIFTLSEKEFFGISLITS
jgi:hypothetical protein